MRIPREKLRGIEADERKQFLDARAMRIAAALRSSRGTSAMFSFDGVMRKKAGFLNHVADVAAQRDRIPLERRAALDLHFAARSARAGD